MFDCVIVMAGSGSRSGLLYNKALYQVNNKPLYYYSLRTFLNVLEVKNIVLVVNKDDEAIVKDYIKEIKEKNIIITIGGLTRQDSVINGVLKTTSDIILVHDAARPLIQKEDILRVYQEVLNNDVSFLATTIKDTLRDKKDMEIINRDNIISVLTPQGFKKDLYLKSVAKALKDSFVTTDDIGLIMQYNKVNPIAIITENNNIKVTTKNDISLIKYYLEKNYEN